MFMQDLLKSSIQIEEDVPVVTTDTPIGEGGPTPALRTPSDEGDMASTLKANLGTPPGMKIAAIIGQPDSNTD
jgi:hypothetical protein